MKSEKVEINPERYLGFLLVCVCAAEGEKDGSWIMVYGL